MALPGWERPEFIILHKPKPFLVGKVLFFIQTTKETDNVPADQSGDRSERRDP